MAKPNGTKRRLMEEMTVKDMREALTETKTVLVPLGVVEQHGYHLPLSTDIHNAYEVSKRVSEKTGVIVAPPLNYSFSGGTLPGTINITPQVMALVVMDICRSLIQQGFKNVVLVLGHGGTENVNALKDCTVLFLRQNPQYSDVVLALASVADFSKTWMKAFKEHDFHAALIETSVMMYWKPELVRKEMVTDEPKLAKALRVHQDNYMEIKKPIESPFVVPFIRQKPEMKVGVMGDPKGANAKLGKKVCDESVAGLTRFIKKIEARSS